MYSALMYSAPHNIKVEVNANVVPPPIIAAAKPRLEDDTSNNRASLVMDPNTCSYIVHLHRQ